MDAVLGKKKTAAQKLHIELTKPDKPVPR